MQQMYKKEVVYFSYERSQIKEYVCAVFKGVSMIMLSITNFLLPLSISIGLYLTFPISQSITSCYLKKYKTKWLEIFGILFAGIGIILLLYP